MPDGAITVLSSVYRGVVPLGSSAGSYGYGITALELEEFDARVRKSLGGEEVAYVHPSYSYYATLAEIQGARIRTFGLTADFRLAEGVPLILATKCR